MSLTYDREKWKRAMDAAAEAIKLCESNGYKLYGGSTTDFVTGAKNYHEAFVGPTSSPSFNNWDEILFGLSNQSTISYTVKSIAPRYGLKNGKYSANGFQGMSSRPGAA